MEKKLIGSYSPELDILCIKEAGTYNSLCIEEDSKYGTLFCGMENSQGGVDSVNCAEIDDWRELCLPHAFDIVNRVSKVTGWDEKAIWDAILTSYLPKQNIPTLWQRQEAS